MIVRYTTEAQADLTAILAYLHGENPRAAVAILNRLDEVAERLAQFPKSGEVVADAQVRMVPLIRFPYLISDREERTRSEYP